MALLSRMKELLLKSFRLGVARAHTALEDSADKAQNVMLNSEIARRFLQLDCNAFERLGRYETALWRQVYQVIFVLDVLTTTKPRPKLASSIIIKHALSSIWIAAFAKVLT